MRSRLAASGFYDLRNNSVQYCIAYVGLSCV